MLNLIDERCFLQSETGIPNKIDCKEKEVIKKIMSICLNSLNKKHDDFHSKRTSKGSTGITYICSLKREALVKNGIGENDLPSFARVLDDDRRSDQKDLLFILKYLNKNKAASERFCSDLYKNFELTAPNLVFLGSEKISSKKNGKNFMEQIHNSNLGDSGEVAFMYAFEAADLGSLIKTKALFELNRDDFKKLITNIGEVVILDLLIANDDRFFRYSQDNANRLKDFCNNGNIMFKLNKNKLGRELLETYYIDNGSTASLEPKIKNTYDEIEELCGIFGEEKESQITETSLLNHNLSVLDPLPDNTSYIEAFNYYTQRGNLPELAQIIAVSFIQQLEESLKFFDKEHVFFEKKNTETFYEEIAFIKENLILGFEKTLTKIEKKPLDEILIFLEKHPDIKNPYCKIISELIKSSLEKKVEIQN